MFSEIVRGVWVSIEIVRWGNDDLALALPVFGGECDRALEAVVLVGVGLEFRVFIVGMVLQVLV